MLSQTFKPVNTDCAVYYSELCTDQARTGFEFFSSQVKELVILPNGATQPTDWTKRADMKAVIDNASEDNTKAKLMLGIGDVPPSVPTIYTPPKGKILYGYSLYTLNFTFKNLDDNGYEFLRILEAHPRNFTFWYGTVGNHLFGNDGGIKPWKVEAYLPLDRSQQGVEHGNIVLQWWARTSPNRVYMESLSDDDIVNNIFGFGGGTAFGFNGTSVFGF